ncbi:ATP-binding protein [Actinophytocola oryzae]|uniref:ATPase family protein associated with various cellular activities (AAA) n=1 Tax=Actinophytocola oryzae TaxID=502181 RepID=A0A4R7UWP9_9PSEU|nr:ATP-binding protein [Actinophytocola oryzae]TDV38681.1 ATPase family protein associated with various cellular activities (AAA) [Actinophytocola oryzae]
MNVTDAHELARAVRELFESAQQALRGASGSPLIERITGHLGCPMAEIPNVALHLPMFEHVNLQRGVDAYLARHTPDAAWFGIAGNKGFLTVIDMLAEATNGSAYSSTYQLGAVDYTTVATGPSASTEAVQLGLVCTSAPDGSPVVLALQGAQEDRGEERCHLQILAAHRTTAAAVREEISKLMRGHDAFRGQVLSFGVSEHHHNQLLTFLPRPSMAASDVVLPEGVLALIERHVVRSATQTEALRAQGQHLKRGLLLYGPPGTGKTHTVRYLLSRLPESTVFVLSGVAMFRYLRATTALARRLAPSVVVVEDVDLIAEDRSRSDGNPVLFELLNEMDGIGSEADVTFVLTTNRVEVMEEALTQRPGRVDLAVEVPKPDGECRERLFRLYAASTSLVLPSAGSVVEATEGVTASFIKELVRRSVLRHIDEGGTFDEKVVDGALAELMAERQTLTRSILGGR